MPFHRTGHSQLLRVVRLLALAAALVSPLAGANQNARNSVLEKAATTLEARYVDADKGTELAAALRQAVQTQRFGSIEEPEAFAKAVTEQLRAVIPDLHLSLRYTPQHEFDAGAQREVKLQRVNRRKRGNSSGNASATANGNGAATQVVRNNRMDPRSLEELAASNFGVGKVEQLEGKVGYLQINRFVPAELARDTLRKAISQIADSEAVIIDLRGNIGGAPDTVGELLSPFFSADQGSVELHVAENRAMGIRAAVETDPSQSRPQLVTAPLYILTDERSASSAELTAYAAHRLGRATLIGARTAGAGQGAARHDLGEGFALWLSEWKMVSGPGWEQVGVTPDVEVDPATALDTALGLIKQRSQPAA